MEVNPKLAWIGTAGAIALGAMGFFDIFASNLEPKIGVFKFIGLGILLTVFLLAFGVSVAHLISQRLEMMNNRIYAKAEEHIERSASKIVHSFDQASERVTNAAQISHDASQYLIDTSHALRQATADLTALRDSILSQNDWFYPYDRFARREAEICDTAFKEGRSVNIVIVSSSLKFDTDITLLPIVCGNLNQGANYTYVVPKRALSSEKSNLRRLAERVVKRPESIRFIELDGDDELFFFEYAIFYFERPVETLKQHLITDYEAYMALDTTVKVTSVPWMRLRDHAREMLWAKVDSLLQVPRSPVAAQ